MPLVPSHHCEFTVCAPLEAVRQAIANEVVTRGFLNWTSSGPRLIGRETTDGFQVRRAIEGRNSFEPRIRIHLTPCPEGTLVQAEFTLSLFVLAFIPVWFIMLLQFMSVALYLAIADGEFLPIAALLVMGGFGAGFTWWGVKVALPRGAVSGEQLLREIVEPEVRLT